MSRLMVLFALAGALQGQPCSAAGDRMLVFTRTAGYRHDSIPAAVAAIRDLAARHGIEVEHTEDAGVFRPDDLARFKAVGFVNTTGNVLDREQQRAFEAFVAAGGGYRTGKGCDRGPSRALDRAGTSDRSWPRP